MYPAQCCVQPAMYSSHLYPSSHFLASPPKADDATAPGSTFTMLYGSSTGSASMLPSYTPHERAAPTQSLLHQAPNFTPHSPEKQDDGDLAAFDYKNVMVWLNQQACGGTTKRKRKINRKQRSAANQRERRRMVHLNVAFDKLRQRIPTFPHEKKLSRIQTLKFAIDYIALMTDILRESTDGNKAKSSTSDGSPRKRDNDSPRDQYWH